MANISRFRVRILIFFLLLAVPVIRLLLNAGYGFFHTEVLAAFLLIIGVSAGLAALGRWPIVFHAQIIGLSILLSFNAVQVNFLPDLRMRWIIAGLGALLTAAILLLRSHFYPVLLIFLAGSLATDVGQAIIRFAGTGEPAISGGQNRNRHVIHVVFDELIGFAGLPTDCASCTRAGGMLRDVLAHGNFRVYPYAFSNYRGTQDSVPSILNDRLITRTGEFFPPAEPRPFLRQNKYFRRYLDAGYAVRVYQSDYILYAAPEFPQIAARTYPAYDIKLLHRLSMSWIERLRQIGVVYLKSDHSWLALWSRFLPSSWDPQSLLLAPLAAGQVWPAALLADCRRATGNTLFFAHIMKPHYPYVYRADGSLGDPNGWWSHSRMDFYEGETPEYRRRYEMYGDQVQVLARELKEFFDGLRAAGLYDSATIVIHGDHGSRLRLLKESERKERQKLQSKTPYCSAVNRYDYPGEPELQDLLNRYSTLLAIKPPEARSPEVIADKGSVLYFLRVASGTAVAPSEYDPLNSVYLFHSDGSPETIPILKYWQQ
jgi:hypothetical protein